MSMDELFKETAKSVPNLAALGLIVFLFLKHLSNRDKDYLESNRALHEENMNARREMIVVIKDSTDATRDLARAVASCPLKITK